MNPSRFGRRRGHAKIGAIGSGVDLESVPQYQAAWNGIAAQITSEGGSSLDLAAAQNDLQTAFDNLTSSNVGFGLDPQTALTQAAQYVTAGQTVAGAAEHVAGLISAAQGGSPVQAFQMFTGTMIGAATAAGALSAGVGALIVGGVGIALGLLQQVGLFGSTGPTWSLVVGSAGSTDAKVIQPGSQAWRTFPKPGVSGDAGWYGMKVQQLPKVFASNSATPQLVANPQQPFVKNPAPFSWKGSAYGTASTWGAVWVPAIDAAFPTLKYFSCQTVPAALHDFNAAFYSAWIANQEYALNGLQVQSDVVVLQHLLRLWNRSHTASSYVDVAPAAFSGAAPTWKDNGKGVGVVACGSPHPPYFATLVQDAIDANDPNIVSGKLRIHTGAAPKPAAKVIAFHLGPAAAKPVAAVAPISTPFGATRAPTGTTTAVKLVTAFAVISSAAFYVWQRRRKRLPVVPKELRKLLPRRR